MELLQLKYFQTVAKYEHMAHAAEALHIAQPTLSKSISRLENDLGVNLFDRQGRRIKLNDYGKVFLKRVDLIFYEIEEGTQELAEMADVKNSNISVALNIPSMLPSILEGFLKQYPDMNLHTEIGAISEMKQKLKENVLDFAISSPPVRGEHIVSVPLLEEEIFLLVPKTHRLAGRKEIDLSEVKDEPFIAFKKGYGIRDLMEEFCSQAGFLPHIVYEGDTATLSTELVNIGLGIALLPSSHKWGVLKDSQPVYLHIRKPVCIRTIALSYPKEHRLPEGARHFHKYILDYFESLRENPS